MKNKLTKKEINRMWKELEKPFTKTELREYKNLLKEMHNITDSFYGDEEGRPEKNRGKIRKGTQYCAGWLILSDRAEKILKKVNT